MSGTKINLNIGGKSIDFTVTPEDQANMINATKIDDKVTPMHNFLVRTVDESCKKDLLEFLKIPASTIEICTAVTKEFTPDLKITVGESKG